MIKMLTRASDGDEFFIVSKYEYEYELTPRMTSYCTTVFNRALNYAKGLHDDDAVIRHYRIVKKKSEIVKTINIGDYLTVTDIATMKVIPREIRHGFVVNQDLSKNCLMTYDGFPEIVLVNPISEECWSYVDGYYYKPECGYLGDVGQLIDFRNGVLIQIPDF
jgi:hypothetical protein